MIEMVIAKRRGLKINNHTDMLSSLSSGMTNTIKDSFKIGIVIISFVLTGILFVVIDLNVKSIRNEIVSPKNSRHII